jgi:galactokinase/mevalonate kinase-like predicted kinase
MNISASANGPSGSGMGGSSQVGVSNISNISNIISTNASASF